jgi:hypothetical protein
MKKIILSAWLVFSIQSITRAEEVGVHLDKIDTSQDTTISIKKGASATATDSKKKWTLTEGEDEITGDKDVVQKNAEKNWKTACKDWKSEFKEMNKENKIVSINCGKMTCSKEGVESTCTSKATHKVKILSEE